MERNSTKLTVDQITAICKRCFGTDVYLLDIKELGGGTFNETYLIETSQKDKVVLRIAPSAAPNAYWDDRALMQREHTILPYFASIATLMPKTLLSDFTHQLIGRDYVLQTFLVGDRWSDIEDELTEGENIDLWRQCGEIVRRIHETTGEQFGYPYPGRSYESWHQVILDRFSRIAQSLNHYQAETSYFSTIFDLVKSSQPVFKEIQMPSLLHGDLWTFNMLVSRKNGNPQITGVLDTERAWWGDPLADWIMFLLSIRSDEDDWQARILAFQQGYGALEKSAATQFRQEVYKAIHVGSSMVWGAKHGNREDVERGRQDLERIAGTLTSF